MKVIGTVIAIMLLCLAYILFLQVKVFASLGAVFAACLIGILSSDDDHEE